MQTQLPPLTPGAGPAEIEPTTATPGSSTRGLGTSQLPDDGVFTIGVAGGTGSGKTTLCKALQKEVVGSADGHTRVLIVHETWFYRDVPKGVDPMMYNFDHPDALDEDLIVETLTHLKQRRTVHLTPYDLTTSTRAVESTTLEPHDVVVLEGILVLYSARVRALLDLKLFVDLDSDIRLSARVIRDTALGRELEAILEQYVTMVKPAFEAWAEPTKKFADLVIPRGSENTRAIELVKEHILSVLTKLDGQMAPSPSMDTLDISPGTDVQRESAIARKSNIPH